MIFMKELNTVTISKNGTLIFLPTGTYFDWESFQPFDNDPCSEFLNFSIDKPSSESYQDVYNTPSVIADALLFTFPFETLPNASIDGSDFSHLCDAPYHIQSNATTPTMDTSAYNQTDANLYSQSSPSTNKSPGSSPGSSPQGNSGKKISKDAKYFCTVCGQGCQTRVILRLHLKIHDPNLKCDFPYYIQKPFAEKRDLDRHLASHGITGPLAYFCLAKNCDMSITNGYKGSVRADNIKRHITRRHNTRDKMSKLYK
ncbi:hypothetical protein EAF04_003374 [Stromatinia cepivora]|nr:hypothetical protein EAF04_003374 [Stromatinia cepivora]